MSAEAPPASRLSTAWPVRATAVLLLGIGVFPLAEWFDIADPQLWWRRAWHSWTLWVPLVLAVALLLARIGSAWWERRAQSARRWLLVLSGRSFALLVALLTTTLAVSLGGLMFGAQPVTIDELSEQWQAHLLASGRLFARAEPHAEFFSTMQTVSLDGRWFSHFPIGGPALQALGLLAHLPWLVNPALAGIAAIAVYRFASAVGDETDARLATLLFATSPMVLVIAGSRLDHVGTLVAVWIALASLPGWHAAGSDTDARRRALVIGLALGCATAIRPYDGIIAAVVVGFFQLWCARRGGPRLRSLLVQALAGAAPLALLLLVNSVLTGHAFTFAYDVLNGAEHRPGFHMSPLGFVHTPVTGLYRVSTYVMRLNAMLLGWPVPAVALVATAMLLWQKVTRWDKLLCAFVVATLVAYWLYWGDGSFHGPRFLYEVAPVFLLFTARVPAALRARLQSPVTRAAVLLLVPLWFGAAWLLPASRYQPFSAVNLTLLGREPNILTDQLVETVKARGLTNAVVFVDDGWHARLTARLRAIGITPFRAQLLAGNYNACTLQQRLDDDERNGLTPAAVAADVNAVMREPLDARPVPGLPAMEQLALPIWGSVPHACDWEYTHVRGHGLDIARLLPLMPLDSDGRIGGDVVYARDFGARNEALRSRFPGRSWYSARAELHGDTLAIVLAAWSPPR